MKQLCDKTMKWGDLVTWTVIRPLCTPLLTWHMFNPSFLHNLHKLVKPFWLLLQHQIIQLVVMTYELWNVCKSFALSSSQIITSILTLEFLQARCPSCCPNDSAGVPKSNKPQSVMQQKYTLQTSCFCKWIYITYDKQAAYTLIQLHVQYIHWWVSTWYRTWAKNIKYSLQKGWIW